MTTVMLDACGFFRPTVKGNLCQCGWPLRCHAEDVRERAERVGVRWGWRARLLAQPDEADCE